MQPSAFAATELEEDAVQETLNSDWTANEAPSEYFEAVTELEAAREVAGSDHLGETGPYVTPFSLQLRNDTEAQFGQDKSFYRSIKKTMQEVLFTYAIMRVIGVVIFGAYIAMLLWLVENFAKIGGESFLAVAHQALIKSFANADTALGVLLVCLSVASVAVRWFVRFIFFLYINTRGRELSYLIKKHIDDIGSKIMESCSKAQLRNGAGRWSRRAGNWTRVALWQAKRAEYLDRYSSTTTWLVQHYTLLMERLFWAYLAAATLYASDQILRSGNCSGGDCVAFNWFIVSLVTVTAAVGWGLLFRRRGNFWTQEFRKKIAADAGDSPHYFEQVGELVENLVEMVVANQRSGRGDND